MQFRAGAQKIPLILVVAAASLLAACNQQNAYQPPPPQPVKVAPPIQRKVTLYTELTGSTSAVNQVDLVARVQGFLQKVGFKDGDHVTKGQMLFVIEPTPYQTSLQIAQAAQAQQQAVLAQAQADLTRQTDLVQRQAVSQATLDTSKATHDSAAAALDQAKGQVQQAQLNLSYTEVDAPFDGTMSARLVDPGALVGAGGPTKLATIVQIDPIYVTFNFDEQQVLQLRAAIRSAGLTLADLGPIPVEAGLQTEAGYPHTGTLDYVAPTLDTSTGTLPVRAVFDNKDTVFLPGLFVRVRVPIQRDVESLLVPDQALGTNQQGRYLLVVDAKNVVVQHQVEVGDLTDDGLRIIQSGLAPGERVIVGGAERAVPGNIVAPTDTEVAGAKAGP